ncbi:YhgE/Pip C-terminal domain [Slackia heliotrinireducens]|uniref:YhgE/Pip-like protein n=1 Tax=Slackia heliotrinireducens (strain ATCC 29202 / DSM 20476 / NCTC 11029 / RHS 1) TaxID=471855 RepID=C7N3F0_SLAHD|nr:YhgE/Pip domain-containing protein [Slackia heliotrinireducens]ACV23673.1 YhgE/Pip-like protein [Slackia heliotrinireducens DSM 20476]VEH03214.1 YhgE/Pip C-terminal domain [Slackia heliotrinireducens]
MFKGFKFAGLQLEDALASKGLRAALIAAVVIPCLLAAFYLFAYNNPSANLGNIPVAVVNNDAGATIGDVDRNMGEELCDTLSSRTDGMNWSFVTADEAEQGMRAGTYYMILTIPENYSERIASLDTNDPKRASFGITYDQSSNAMASQMGKEVFNRVLSQVDIDVTNQYIEMMLKAYDKAGDSVASTATMSQQLADGANAAVEGTDALAQGISAVGEGTDALGEGLNAVAEGSEMLGTGLTALADNGDVLVTGTSGIAQGITAIGQGAEPLAEGAYALADGLNAASSSMGEALGNSEIDLDGALETANTALNGDGTPENPGMVAVAGVVVDGLNDATDTAATAAEVVGDAAATEEAVTQQALESAQEAADTAAQLRSIAETTEDEDTKAQLLTLADNLDATAATLSASAEQLGASAAILSAQADPEVKQSLAELAANMPLYSEQAGQYYTQLQGFAESLNGGEIAQMLAGIQAMTDPETGLAAQLGAAAQGMSGIAMGIEALGEGANQLGQGADALSQGMGVYVAGVDAVAESAAAMPEGLYQIADAASSISTGTDALAEGASAVGEGLAMIGETNETMAADLEENADALRTPDAIISERAEALSNPVKIEETYYTTTKSYAIGMAPFFVAIGLWVAAILTSFVLPALNRRMALAGGNPVSVALSGYLPYALFALVQALLLLLVLQYGLHLNPDNVLAYYGFGFVAALAFAAILQLLSAAFGLAGRLFGIVWLAIQLPACMGTFPIETASPLFQALSPLSPLTYLVEGMRQIITGIGVDLAMNDAAVLAALGVGALVLTSVVAWRRGTVRMSELKPDTTPVLV